MGLHNARRIAYQSVQRATNNFGNDTYVGTFQFGKVYCGKFRFGPCYLDDFNGKDFVLKLYDDPKAKPGVIERRLRDELDLLDIHEGEHPGFVKLLAFFWEDEKVGVVYEIDAIDSLWNLVTKDSFTWPQRVKAAVRLACFLNYMHLPASRAPHLPYLIRNLDAAHIIINKDYCPLLYDYSMITGGDLADRRELIDQQVDGCLGYVDPGHCLHRGGNQKCDVFAFGMILLTLISQGVYSKKDDSGASSLYNWACSEFKKHMLVNSSKFSLVSPSMQAGELLTKYDGWKITTIVMRCLDPNPARRPTMSKVFEALCNLRIVRQWEKIHGINMTLFEGFDCDPPESRLSGYLRSTENLFHRSSNSFHKSSSKLRRLLHNIFLQEPSQTIFSPLLPGEKDTVKVFSMSELSSYTNGFSDQNLIGICEVAKIFRGDMLGKMVTVKKCEYENRWWHVFFGDDNNQFWDELDLLHHPRFRYHCNIPTLIGYCFDQRDFAMVYDLDNVTTMHDLLLKVSFTWLHRIRVILRLAHVIEYIHRPYGSFTPCIVCNLHPINILIDQDMNPILFNFSDFRGGFLPNRDLFRRYVAGHMRSHPVNREWTQKADVHQFGVCMLAMLTKKKDNPEDPFDSRLCMVSALEYMALGSYERRPSLVHEELAEDKEYCFKDGAELTAIAIKCVTSEPGDYPSMREVVKRLRKLKVVREDAEMHV